MTSNVDRWLSSDRASDVAAAPNERTDLFPLPLVPFEHYMVADDRAGYPMTFPIRVELWGKPNREAMDAALADALKRHPLLSARLRRRGTRWSWVPGNGQAEMEWTPRTDRRASSLAGQPIDLTRLPGVRVMGTADDERTTLSLLFHHAACDGIGAFRFIGDLLACYGQRTASEAMRPRLLPLDPANLRDRGAFDLRLPGVISSAEVLRSTLREGWKVLSRRPRPLLTHHRPRTASPSRLHVQSLDASDYTLFCQRASEAGVTTNDLLMRDMFLTLFQWNRSHASRSKGWLRITMPTSLRGKRDSRMPATNVLGYAFVTRHTDECMAPRELLTGLAAETATIREWSMGAMFVETLRQVERIPGLLATATRLNRRFSTVVLSNVGDPVRRFRARFPSDGKITIAGDLRIRNIYGAPPVRPGTRAALALSAYADQLSLAMMVDPKWVSDDDAAEFLRQYRDQLLQSAGGTR